METKVIYLILMKQAAFRIPVMILRCLMKRSFWRKFQIETLF